MYNCRGQLQSVVDKSVEIGESRELVFIDYFKTKGIELIKQDKYKTYDFIVKGNKNIKIEFKTSNHAKEKYKQVFLGVDKVKSYKEKQEIHNSGAKAPDNIFILVFGFYKKIDNDNIDISYHYDVIDTNIYLKDYNRRLIYCKDHIEIPTNKFKPIRDFITFIREY